MPFPETLSSDDLTQLRATSHFATQYIVVNPETTVFAAQVSQIDFEDVLASVFYDTVTTGAYTDIKPGMLVLISRTNDKRAAFFKGRIRKAADSTTLHINETSARIQDNDYIFVVKEYPLREKIPRYVDGTIYADYEIEYRAPLPLIHDLQSSYVVLGNSNVDLALAPSAAPIAEGASISTWAWTLDGGTFQSGSSSTQNITARFASTGVYWITLTVTDSNGNSNFMAIMVCIVPTDFSSVVSGGFEGASITRDLNLGASGTVTAFDGVENVRSGTRITIFTVESYDGTAVPIVTNIDFVGYLKQESISSASSLAGLISKTQFQIEGFGVVAGKVFLSSFGFEDRLSPAAFGEITNLTPYRIMAFIASELSTLSNVCSIDFDNFDNTYRYQIDGIDNNVSLMDALVSDIGYSINARLQFAASGEILVARSARYAADTFDTIADWGNRDWINDGLTIEIDPDKRFGRATGGGVWLNSSNAQSNYISASAPAVMADEGSQPLTLNGQVLPLDSTEDGGLGARVASHLVAENPYPRLRVKHRSGYHWLIPMVDRWYTHTITSDENNRGLSYTTSNKWLCEEVSITHNNQTGVRTTEAVYGIKTELGEYVVATIRPPGPAAQNPQPPTSPFTSFPVDPTLTYPSDNPDPEDVPGGGGGGGTPGETPVPDTDDPETPAEKNGQVLIAANTEQVHLLTDYWKSSVPKSKNIFNSSDNPINDVLIDTSTRRIWVLTNDGEDYSYVWRANNFYNPSWSSVRVEGLYSVIRRNFDAPGGVAIYSPDAAPSNWMHTFQFDTPSGADPNTTYANGGGFAQITPANNAAGQYSAGNGIIHTTDTSDNGNKIRMSATFTPGTYTSVVVHYSMVVGTGPEAPPVNQIAIRLYSGGALVAISQKNSATGSSTVTWSNPSGVTVDKIDFRLWASDGGAEGSVTVSKIVVHGIGENPFTGGGGGGSGNAVVRWSTDYGATFGSAVTVGDAAEVACFDTSKTGAISMGAADTLVRDASSAGGSYSDEYDFTPRKPKAIWVYGKSTLSYIAAADNNDVNSLVDGGADISPVISMVRGVVVHPEALTMCANSDEKIWMIGIWSGVHKIAYTTDGGTNWNYPQNLTGSGACITTRLKGDGTYVYAADNDIIYGSKDGGATWINKQSPIGSLLLIRVA